ncbi:MAG: elongation factor G [Candidatus Izemoplasmataceae bacterium]
MKGYDVEKLRTIAVTGHIGSGKSTFMESVLYMTGTKPTKGVIEEKNTTSDYLDEEKERLNSLSTSVIPIEHDGYMYVFLDTPGNHEFLNELHQALSVVKGAILVIDGTKGLDVGTEEILEDLNDRNIPTIILINKMDKENVEFASIINRLKDIIGYQVVPFLWPIGEAENFKGYVDLVDMDARVFDGEKTVKQEIPDELKDSVGELREKIVESVAETSEELLEKHFAGEELTQEEIRHGLRTGVLNGDLKPVVIGSAKKDIGTKTILEMIGHFMASPQDLKPKDGIHPKDGSAIERPTKRDEPFSGYVFKTIVDPFVGSVNYVKVFSGVLKGNTEVHVPNIEKNVKVGNVAYIRGKEQIATDEIGPGDIGVVSKIEGLRTGHTMCDPKHPIQYQGPEIPEPTIYQAVRPVHKRDEDKISEVLNKLHTEDPSFQVWRNKETKQLLIGGQGMSHIKFLVDKMANTYHVEVELMEQKIPYRETIRKKVEAEGRHKKQSGGSGQFGVVNIRFEPAGDRETTLEFNEEIHGGSVPKNYFPAVEKGLLEIMQKGPLAGYPVIGLKATLFDGSYHPVDSNEVSFKQAAALAFKKAYEKANPTLLEPISKVTITCKDDYVGDVMSDITRKRGTVLGMSPIKNNKQVIEAEIPDAEIKEYNVDLKALTQGSGSFKREFLRYQEVPDHLVDSIIKAVSEEDH